MLLGTEVAGIDDCNVLSRTPEPEPEEAAATDEEAAAGETEEGTEDAEGDEGAADPVPEDGARRRL